MNSKPESLLPISETNFDKAMKKLFDYKVKEMDDDLRLLKK